jgi:methanogenic corrinoid protein MtbC1
MAGGRRVGQLAKLSEKQLQALVDEDRREAVVQITTEAKQLIHGAPEELVADSLEAISELNAGSLKAAIDRAVFSLPPTEFIEQVATPLMHRVGELWHRRQLSPAHEHLASNVTRNALSEMIAALQPQNGVHRLVVATPAGQAHELAAVLVAASAQLEGWAVTYLGPDLPAVDIANAVEQTGAEAVALSITVSPADPQPSDELHAVRQSLPSDVTVLVGGQAASALQSDLNAIGARYMDDLNQVRMTLRELAGSNDASEG